MRLFGKGKKETNQRELVLSSWEKLAMNNNTWHHIAITHEKKTSLVGCYSLYVDGLFKKSTLYML